MLLEDMPTYIGAYYPEGSTYIVLNRALVTKLKAVIASDLEYNSFIFVILMHEYLHSLGFYSEKVVRGTVTEICRNEFGQNSKPYEQAISNWLEKYPQLNFPVITERSFEIVRDFDFGSQPYIG